MQPLLWPNIAPRFTAVVVMAIAKDLRPFREAEVGGDDHAGALIELAQEMEQQRAA